MGNEVLYLGNAFLSAVSVRHRWELLLLICLLELFMHEYEKPCSLHSKDLQLGFDHLKRTSYYYAVCLNFLCMNMRNLALCMAKFYNWVLIIYRANSLDRILLDCQAWFCPVLSNSNYTLQPSSLFSFMIHAENSKEATKTIYVPIQQISNNYKHKHQNIFGMKQIKSLPQCVTNVFDDAF